MRGANDYTVLGNGVNWVAVTSETTLGLPSMIMALYLHPDDEVVNQETKDGAMQAVARFGHTHSNQHTLIVIGGDLNMD